MCAAHTQAARELRRAVEARGRGQDKLGRDLLVPPRLWDLILSGRLRPPSRLCDRLARDLDLDDDWKRAAMQLPLPDRLCIREARVLKHLSVAAAAARVGMSVAAWAAVESGVPQLPPPKPAGKAPPPVPLPSQVIAAAEVVGAQIDLAPYRDLDRLLAAGRRAGRGGDAWVPAAYDDLMAAHRALLRLEPYRDEWARGVREGLKRRRLDRDLSTRHAADLAGLSGTYLRSLEEGMRPLPGTQVLRTWALSLDVDEALEADLVASAMVDPRDAVGLRPEQAVVLDVLQRGGLDAVVLDNDNAGSGVRIKLLGARGRRGDMLEFPLGN